MECNVWLNKWGRFIYTELSNYQGEKKRCTTMYMAQMY